jgi:hypothetical protein
VRSLQPRRQWGRRFPVSRSPCVRRESMATRRPPGRCNLDSQVAPDHISPPPPRRFALGYSPSALLQSISVSAPGRCGARMRTAVTRRVSVSRAKHPKYNRSRRRARKYCASVSRRNQTQSQTAYELIRSVRDSGRVLTLESTANPVRVGEDDVAGEAGGG